MCKNICLQCLAYEELPSQKLSQQTVWSRGSLLPRVSAWLSRCTRYAVLPAIPASTVRFDNNAPTVERFAIANVFFLFLIVLFYDLLVDGLANALVRWLFVWAIPSAVTPGTVPQSVGPDSYEFQCIILHICQHPECFVTGNLCQIKKRASHGSHTIMLVLTIWRY